MKQRPVCDKCGTVIPHDSNFCPKCGDPVLEEDFLQLVSVQERPKIEITFGFSTSPSYKGAVDFASRFPTYRSEGEGKEIKHYVSFELEDIEAAITLWEMIANWKSSKMSLGGEPITKKNLIYGALGCWRERQKSPLPEVYCSESDHAPLEQNLWGCRRLGIYNYAIFSPWGEFCEFVEDRFLLINKKELGKKLAFAYLQNRLCPALDRDRIAQAFSLIPEKIDVLKYKGPLEPFLEEARYRVQQAIEREKRLRELEKNISKDLHIVITDEDIAGGPKKQRKGIKSFWWIWFLFLVAIYLLFK